MCQKSYHLRSRRYYSRCGGPIRHEIHILSTLAYRYWLGPLADWVGFVGACPSCSEVGACRLSHWSLVEPFLQSPYSWQPVEASRSSSEACSTVSLSSFQLLL